MNPNIIFFFSDKIFNGNNFDFLLAIIAFSICILIPIGNFIYGVIQFIFIGKKVLFENNKEEVNLFKKYSAYIGAYLILTFLLILLFIFDCFIQDYDKGKKKLFRYYSYIITLLSLMTPVIVGVLRFIQVYTRSEKFNRFMCCCCSKNDDEINLDELGSDSKSIPLSSSSSDSANALRPMKTLEFEHFEKVSMKKVYYYILYQYSLSQKYISQFLIALKKTQM